MIIYTIGLDWIGSFGDQGGTAKKEDVVLTYTPALP